MEPESALALLIAAAVFIAVFSLVYEWRWRKGVEERLKALEDASGSED